MRPKASRMERQVRKQIGGLNGVAWLLLIGCMAMTAMFGWGLGRTIVDKVIFAGSLMAIDLGGALAMKSSGTFSANGEGRGVFWSSVAAAICAAITFLGMLGFQSESREAQVAAREQSAKIAADMLAWSKGMAVDATLVTGAPGKGKDAGKEVKDRAASTAMTMTAGIEAVGKVVRDQIGMLQSGELVVTGDGQGAALSRLSFGLMTEAQARSWVMTAISAAFLAVQYLFQWLAGFMRHRVEPVVAAMASTSEDGQVSKFAKFAKSAKYLAARRDVLAVHVRNEPYPSNVEWARRWGVSTTTACHWLQAVRSEGHDIPTPQRGGRRVARLLNGSASVNSGDNHAPAINGRAHAV